MELSASGDLIESYVRESGEVSAQQRAAIEADRNFFLTACPGSGKTRTVGVRLAYWSAVPDPELGRTRRVAATSFTNTAIREILRAVDAAGGSAADPQFVGTLHRFLMRYVVRPFGSGVMGCEGPPRIVASTSSRKGEDDTVDFKHQWSESTVSVWDFHWAADGSLSTSEVPYSLKDKLDPDELSETLQQRVRTAKIALARRGLLSMSDALYWAMRVLEDDHNAQAVASRFDELIVDEAQDTTDVQQICLRRLHESGLHSIVFVGDMNQAIYGFANAQPERIRSLVDDIAPERIELNENWRSSQAICDVSHHFADTPGPDVAVGPARDYGLPPELHFYAEEDVQVAVDGFVQRLRELELDPADSVVLCRSRATTEELTGNGQVSLGRGGFRIMVAAVAAARGLSRFDRDVVREVENLVLSLVDPDAELEQMSSDEHLSLRLGVMRMLDSLPDFDMASKEWAKAARGGLTELMGSMVADPPSAAGQVRTPSGAGTLPVSTVMGELRRGPEIRTIHAAKGESHTATLLMAVGDNRSTNWELWLEGPESEEVRIAYVALTRARRYGSLALPDSCPREIVDVYLSRGFRLSPK